MSHTLAEPSPKSIVELRADDVHIDWTAVERLAARPRPEQWQDKHINQLIAIALVAVRGRKWKPLQSEAAS